MTRPVVLVRVAALGAFLAEAAGGTLARVVIVAAAAAPQQADEDDDADKPT